MTKRFGAVTLTPAQWAVVERLVEQEKGRRSIGPPPSTPVSGFGWQGQSEESRTDRP